MAPFSRMESYIMTLSRMGTSSNRNIDQGVQGAAPPSGSNTSIDPTSALKKHLNLLFVNNTN